MAEGERSNGGSCRRRPGVLSSPRAFPHLQTLTSPDSSVHTRPPDHQRGSDSPLPSEGGSMSGCADHAAGCPCSMDIEDYRFAEPGTNVVRAPRSLFPRRSFGSRSPETSLYYVFLHLGLYKEYVHGTSLVRQCRRFSKVVLFLGRTPVRRHFGWADTLSAFVTNFIGAKIARRLTFNY